MQVEAIYEQGRLKFVQPISLRCRVVRVLVEIPESELIQQPQSPPHKVSSTSRTSDRLNAILGRYRQASDTDVLNYKDAWHTHLEGKYLDRD